VSVSAKYAKTTGRGYKNKNGVGKGRLAAPPNVSFEGNRQ
jgi:hypothetical protein